MARSTWKTLSCKRIWTRSRRIGRARAHGSGAARRRPGRPPAGGWRAAGARAVRQHGRQRGRCRSGASLSWPNASTRRSPSGSPPRVSFVSTTVDRITPRTEPDEAAAVLAATGKRDDCPVVTEPFAEWALCGRLPGRTAAAGTTPAPSSPPTSTPYENRKLWLLNGAHSLLAYAGSIRGHATVARGDRRRRPAANGSRTGGPSPARTSPSRPR